MPTFSQTPGELDIEAVLGTDFALSFNFSSKISDFEFEAGIILNEYPSQIIFPLTTTVSGTQIVNITLSDAQTEEIGVISNKKWYLKRTKDEITQMILSGRFQISSVPIGQNQVQELVMINDLTVTSLYAVGAHGATGATGNVGATGIGATGATGLVGATGLGATGATGNVGATGDVGATGLGATGPVGNTGINGATGATGLTGATGQSGTSFRIKGTVETLSALPTFGNQVGDLYIVTDQYGHGYAFNGLGWTDVGEIKGSSGSSGATGIEGATGLTGATGLGATGATGNVGATGLPGITGEAGINTIYGDSNPIPPLVPIEGQRWVDTETLIEYQWYDDVWVEVNAPMLGLTGATGATGASGGITLNVTSLQGGIYLVNAVNNPALYFIRGNRYVLNINAAGHPFYFQTSGLTYTPNLVYTDGVTGSGTAVGTIIFEVPYNAPSSLTYVCSNHANMGNVVNISNLGPSGATGATGNVGATGVVPTNASFTTITTSGEAGFGIPVETKATPAISAGTLTLNLSTATLFYTTLNAITSVVFSNTPTSPKVFSFTLQLVANGTAYAVTWPTSVKWQNGIPPIITSINTKIDTFTFLTHDGGTTYFGFVSGKNF